MSQQSVNDVLQEWREAAPNWEKYGPLIRSMFNPITEAMIAEAQIANGHSVLDVAGGIGEPALTVANAVGKSGVVTCTDAAREMVAAAAREAERRGCDNITFAHCLGQSLPFKDGTFDSVVCRLGVMFFPEPGDGLTELLRVTKPGGTLTLAVWDRQAFNPFIWGTTEVLSRYIESSPPDSDAPGPFRFAESGLLARLLKESGAAAVSERQVSFRIQVPIPLEDLWPMRSEMSPTLRKKLAQLSPDQVIQVRQEIEDGARQFFPDGMMDFPAQVIVVTGRKLL